MVLRTGIPEWSSGRGSWGGPRDKGAGAAQKPALAGAMRCVTGDHQQLSGAREGPRSSEPRGAPAASPPRCRGPRGGRWDAAWPRAVPPGNGACWSWCRWDARGGGRRTVPCLPPLAEPSRPAVRMRSSSGQTRSGAGWVSPGRWPGPDPASCSPGWLLDAGGSCAGVGCGSCRSPGRHPWPLRLLPPRGWRCQEPPGQGRQGPRSLPPCPGRAADRAGVSAAVTSSFHAGKLFWALLSGPPLPPAQGWGWRGEPGGCGTPCQLQPAVPGGWGQPRVPSCSSPAPARVNPQRFHGCCHAWTGTDARRGGCG